LRLALFPIEPMVRPDDVAGNGVPHASAVSHPIPGHPDGSCADRDEKPDQSVYCPRHWGGRKARVEISANLERTDPTTTRPANRAKAPGANRRCRLGLPTGATAQR
jgi:hypothetical protein